jgi:hypothetical protein
VTRPRAPVLRCARVGGECMSGKVRVMAVAGCEWQACALLMSGECTSGEVYMMAAAGCEWHVRVEMTAAVGFMTRWCIRNRSTEYEQCGLCVTVVHGRGMVFERIKMWAT